MTERIREVTVQWNSAIQIDIYLLTLLFYCQDSLWHDQSCKNCLFTLLRSRRNKRIFFKC